MVAGTAMVASLKFATSTYPLHIGDLTIPGYVALYSLILNVLVSAALTIVMRMAGVVRPPDETSADDYHGGPETERA
jgi:SSS family solute:Na+ symporter